MQPEGLISHQPQAQFHDFVLHNSELHDQVPGKDSVGGGQKWKGKQGAEDVGEVKGMEPSPKKKGWGQTG